MGDRPQAERQGCRRPTTKVRGQRRTATTVSNCCLPWLLSSTLACTIQ